MPPHSIISFLSLLVVIILSSSTAALSLRYQCNPADKKTLLKIKAEFRNPLALASWNSSTNCCSWKRVTCDKRGYIFSLNIAGPNFSGPVPPSIGNLRFLSILIFRRTNLNGTIPVSFSNLTNLNVLFIRNTAISGFIPDFLGNLQLLEQIFLENNQFSGPIPGSLFKKLKIKDAKPILFVYNNRLTGEITTELGNVDFDGIDLSRNQLRGDSSLLFGAKKKTRKIKLSLNQLSFNLSGIGFPKLLEELDLSHNNITGSIPRSIAGLKNLVALDLSHNQLCGKIPTGGPLGVFDWRSYYKNKCLCGAPLPRCGT